MEKDFVTVYPGDKLWARRGADGRTIEFFTTKEGEEPIFSVVSERHVNPGDTISISGFTLSSV